MPKRRHNDDAGNAEPKRDLVLLGRISGAHGIRGEVKLTSFTAAPEDIAAYGPLTDGAGRCFSLRNIRSGKGITVTAAIEGIADRNAAEALKGVELFIEREALPDPDVEEWYHADLIGLAAISPEGEPVGEVLAVQNFGASDLLEIRQPGQRQTLLVPFTRAAVPMVDVKGGHIVIAPQEEIEDDGGVG